ncbi:MAG TPA: glycosyltransferase family 39 protein, partial [Baekduia sp.]|nr:glycosyltransferase family 39 protein [Baekduia sp.]
MSTARAAEPTAAHGPGAGASAPGTGARRILDSPWSWVAGLYVLSVAVYLLLALRSPLPVLFPDEFRYSHLARALADGQGFDWRGQHIRQSAALYVYFITPAWALLHSTVDAYHASKALGTLALCTQVVPVWLLGRELVGPRLALLPAALAVAGTWMLSSAEAVTETLAFPLTTAALCVAVMALRRPGSRFGWLALALLGLATWARLQVGILVPALLVALLLDVVRDPVRRRERLRAHRPYLVAAGAGLAAIVVVGAAAPSLAGDYAEFFSFRPSLHRILSKSGLQLLELVATAGLVPVLLAAAAALSPRAWRDDRTGPLLAVFWPAALATVLQSG